MMIRILLVIAVSYLLGCVPTGDIVSRLYKVNLRAHGSGNIGATNAYRVLGAKASALTLVGDALKGVLAALLGLFVLGGMGGAMTAGVFAVIGHDFPVFSRFKGGKGVATSFGMLLVAQPLVALSLLVLIVIITGITKIQSIAALTASMVYIVYTLIAHFNQPVVLVCGLAVAVLLIYCHRGNVERLKRGTENKLTFKKRA